jgi:endonuclease/exonuclease/phosphatase family metal-dependent hydrolase
MPPAALDQMAKNASIRAQQAKHILKRYRLHRGALLLLGDFNEEFGDATDLFTGADFADACRARYARCSATWPGATTPWPAITRIDKVLGRNVEFTHSWVPAGGGSDHQPIVAVIDLGK